MRQSSCQDVSMTHGFVEVAIHTPKEHHKGEVTTCEAPCVTPTHTTQSYSLGFVCRLATFADKYTTTLNSGVGNEVEVRDAEAQRRECHLPSDGPPSHPQALVHDRLSKQEFFPNGSYE
mmetsp:Transcript_63882/g.74291  ORF Transcript_63882/g.74291 Transcript_63882/m.74291 type:complete len:119 (+) Transcript_63882:306-662(+)